MKPALVELLIVIAIIGILMAMILPAVQSSRATARRTQCGNNIRQNSMALVQYAQQMGTLPAGQYRRLRYTPTGSCRPDSGIESNHASWTTRILPYLEYKEFFDQIDFKIERWSKSPKNVELSKIRLPILLCPEDQPDKEFEAPRNYVANIGTGYSALLECGDTSRRDGPFIVTRELKLSKFHDGTAKTMLLSECLIGRPSIYFGDNTRFPRCRAGAYVDQAGAPSNRGMTWFEGSQLQYWGFQANLPPNDELTKTQECARWTYMMDLAARSEHIGGVQVALADGSTRFINDDIAITTWRALSTFASGDEVVLP